MSNGENQRVHLWDNIKGALIILVVFGHCLFDSQDRFINDALVDAIYFFHMPAFVFVSGYLSKSENARKRAALVRLLIAYFLFILPFAFADALMGGQPHILEPYASAWYLMALVIWRLVTPVVARSNVVLPLTVIVSLLAGYWPDLGGNPTLSMNKILTLWPFFVAGYRVTRERMSEWMDARIGVRWLIGGSSLVAAVLLGSSARAGLRITDTDLLPGAYATVSFLGPVSRVTIMLVAALCICSLVLLLPRKDIPILTKLGKNSLSIYLLHRIPTMLFAAMCQTWTTDKQLIAAFACSSVLVLVLGSHAVTHTVNAILDGLTYSVLTDSDMRRTSQRVAVGILVGLVFALLIMPVVVTTRKKAEAVKTPSVLREDEEDARNRAFTLLFCGDLILLEDQVRSAWNGTAYDFTSCFEWTKDYIANADFAIGVLEGPCSDLGKDYSRGNYDDGKDLSLNFPREWPEAIRDAGFDLLTLANNHVMDRGELGLRRTLDTLDSLHINHLGAYRNKRECDVRHITLVQRNGIRMVFLAYTMFVNGVDEKDLLASSKEWAVPAIVGLDSPCYETARAQVERDFADARALEPDLLVVLPHWGKRFTDFPDNDQRAWQKTFTDLGADIILGDHTHSVQPVWLEGTKGDATLTVFCPGNYANAYREYNGDCSAMVEVYIDRTTKHVLGGSVIPMWVSSSLSGSYRPLPIYDAIHEPALLSTLTTYDRDRAAEVFSHITKVMLGDELDITLSQKRMHFDRHGFLRAKVEPLDFAENEVKSEQCRLLREASSVCFVGDSITEGTRNGGVPWYEPLEGLVRGDVVNCGWGGETMANVLVDHGNEIAKVKADLFVIALGANDIRYRDETSALNADEYTAHAEELSHFVLATNPKASIVFVAPWTSTDGDMASALGYQEKRAMTGDYARALESWCSREGYVFVDANRRIEGALAHDPQSKYLLDAIHPNAQDGVRLYSEAFLMG